MDKEIRVGNFVNIHCFDGSTITMQVTEVRDNIVYGVSQFGNHWANLKDVEKVITQEDKELLLKDLCARLPYQPTCEFTDTEDDFCTATAALGYSLRDFIAGKVIIKPYLRSMSSMTEEENKQRKELNILLWSNSNGERGFDGFGNISGEDVLKAIDWLNVHHFDYRGLIEKGLALEAPEGMYNFK